MTTNKKLILYSKNGVKEEDEKLLKPLTYLISQAREEKSVQNIVLAFNFWMNIPIDKLQLMHNINQMILNAGLLVDDIQDNSVLRGGIPAAHSIYGIASTLNAAYYGLFIISEHLMSEHPEAVKIFIDEFLRTNRGQGLDIYYRDNLICPTEEEYKKMVAEKTGSSLNFVFKMMQLFSDYKEDLTALSEILGLYFQIRDDYCNLLLQEFTEKKGYCDDLSEGKFSFPIIHAIRNHTDDDQILNILRQRTNNIEVKRYCVKLLEKYGSFKYTRNVLTELDKKARKEIERLGGNPFLTLLLDKLLDWNER